MPERSITATVVRNDNRAVTHYDMKDGASLLGIAVKDEKGEFVFTANQGMGLDGLRAKTMKDLKAAIAAKIPKQTKGNGADQTTATPTADRTKSPPAETGLDPTTGEEGADLDLT